MNNKEITSISEQIGFATNNVAEYKAVIKALEFALAKNYLNLSVKSDSELLIKQILGLYKIKNPELQILFKELMHLKENFISIKFEHIPREKNRRADQLANLAFNQN